MIREKIQKLKKEKNAVIVAHTYEPREIQEIADLVGDSFQLSKFCLDNEATTIVFCGVHFMAESAKILSPHKKVLLPVKEAGCDMADMVTADGLRELKKKHPTAKVVCYINSTAAVKAESDICCTSSNAIKVVKSLNAEKIIFVPDRNLGAYVAKSMPNTEFVLWDGYCPVHNNLKVQDIEYAKKKYPNSVVAVHPECQDNIIKLADYVGSTSGIIDYVLNSNFDEYIIATENGINDRINILDPSKKLITPSACLECKDMKYISVKDVYNSLKNDYFEITLEDDIINKAKGCLERMLEAAK